MNTPICDFVRRYAASGTARLHMPGHKGLDGGLCERLDITEIAGADALYEAAGIIAQSENNASALFGTGATFYSAEGASLCIRAMVYLVSAGRANPVIFAARNAHRSFLSAAALCGCEVEWLYPEKRPASLCACPIPAEGLARRLDARAEKPCAVFVTSPDYLGGRQDVAALARVCRARGVPLVVDNAHGAYLRFLPEGGHPMELGADMCCDSAHKTLPVLTGGAYLHLAKDADPSRIASAGDAMALFGSTSPSYLILQSLDACNARLAGDWPGKLQACAGRVSALKRILADRGFAMYGDEPLKLTLRGDGAAMAEALRARGAECEYADPDYAVMMFAPGNGEEDYAKAEAALTAPVFRRCAPPELPAPVVRLGIREAVFAPSETLPVERAVGRICAQATAGCPPAVPVAVSGEEITPEVTEAMRYYGIRTVRVVR